LTKVTRRFPDAAAGAAGTGGGTLVRGAAADGDALALRAADDGVLVAEPGVAAAWLDVTGSAL
jgi:hypothetical protein